MRIADRGMRKNGKIFLLILCLMGLPLFAQGAAGRTPEIVLSPKKAGPGDILLITVKNEDGPVEGIFNGRKIFFNPSKNSYKAVVGIDLNAEPGRYTLELTINGRTTSRRVTVVRKKYPLQRLKLPEDKVTLSPENEARVEREQNEMAAIWPVESVRDWSGNFSDPLPGKEITTSFGMRRIINNIPKNPHTGVDLSAEEGEPVRAPNDGVAVLVEEQFFSGNSVVLDHGQGIHTMFFHLSKVNVHRGQAVRKGDVIGFVGSTGRVTGACLHWGVRVQGARVDPLELIHLNLE
jgi:murein DD-endopeptidase MepM/ murein hydrolase activator NlpD